MLEKLPAIADKMLLSALKIKGYRSRMIPTSVGRVHTLDAEGQGSLPPVLILHGLSAAGQHYENLMSRLRKHVRRVIAVDMPGHGHSDRPSPGLSQRAMRDGLEEALFQILDEPVVIFGNSLGGAAAIRYASLYPQDVLGLVLAAPGGAAMQEAELARFIESFKLDTHSDALDFVRRLFHRAPPLKHVLAWGIRQQFIRANAYELLQNTTHDDLLTVEELAALSMPVLVLWGKADRILWRSHLEFFARHLPPHAELLCLDEYGHVPHMTHATELTTRICAFMEKLNETGPSTLLPSREAFETAAAA